MDDAGAASSAIDRARAGLLVANLVLVGTLAASGLALLARYRPGSWLATVHGLAGRGLLATAILSLALQLAPRPRLARVAFAVLFVAAVAVALAGGPLLRWSGLWIWAVAVEAGRTSFRGFLWLTGDDVRLVTIGRAELRPAAMLLRLGLHLTAALAAATVAVALVARVRRPGDRVGVGP